MGTKLGKLIGRVEVTLGERRTLIPQAVVCRELGIKAATLRSASNPLTAFLRRWLEYKVVFGKKRAYYPAVVVTQAKRDFKAFLNRRIAVREDVATLRMNKKERRIYNAIVEKWGPFPSNNEYGV